MSESEQLQQSVVDENIPKVPPIKAGYGKRNILIGAVLLLLLGLGAWLMLSKNKTSSNDFRGLTAEQKADPSYQDCDKYIGDDPWGNLNREIDGDFGKCLKAYLALENTTYDHLRKFLKDSQAAPYILEISMAESLNYWCPTHSMNDHPIGRVALLVKVTQDFPSDQNIIPSVFEKFPVCIINTTTP